MHRFNLNILNDYAFSLIYNEKKFMIDFYVVEIAKRKVFIKSISFYNSKTKSYQEK